MARTGIWYCVLCLLKAEEKIQTEGKDRIKLPRVEAQCIGERP